MLQVWVGLTQIHHLIAFADPTTGDHFFDEHLLVINSPQLSKHLTQKKIRLLDEAELGITTNIQRTLNYQYTETGMGWRGDKQTEVRGEWLVRWPSE